MDPAISQLTQKLLGAFVKRPQLTEKLLSRPPFRFLHDLMMSIVQTTGVMNGLFTEEEMISVNVSNRHSKIIFLEKVIEFVRMTSERPSAVSSMKIIAGQEPEQTNKLLQELASVISRNPTNHDDIVHKVLARIASLSKVTSPTPNVKDDHVTSANAPQNIRNIDTPRPTSSENIPPNTEETKPTVTKMLDPNNTGIGTSKLTNEPRQSTSSEKEKNPVLNLIERMAKIVHSGESASTEKEKEHVISEVRMKKNVHSGETATNKVLASTSNASKPGLTNVVQTHPDSSGSVKVVSSLQSIRAAASKKLASSIDQVSELREARTPINIPVRHHSTKVVGGNDRAATPIRTKSSSTNLLSKSTIETLIEEPIENEETKHPITVLFTSDSSKPLQVPSRLESQTSSRVITSTKKSHHKSSESSKIVQHSEAATNFSNTKHSSSEIRKRNKLRPKGAKMPIKSNETEEIKENPTYFEQLPDKPNTGIYFDLHNKRNNSRLTASVVGNESVLVTRPKIILDRPTPSDEEDSDDDVDPTLQIFNLSHLESSFSHGTSSTHSNDVFNDQIAAEHGQLVKKMLETSRRGFEESSKIHTVIDRNEERFNLIRQRERQKASNDTDHLRMAVQGLAGHILELIKVMDIVQEHRLSIQKESDVWRKEIRDNYTLLQLEEEITDASIKPLFEQMEVLDREIADQKDVNASVKVQILDNEGKLLRLIRASSPA